MPSLPDIYGDIVMVIVFGVAYLFTPAAAIKRTVKNLPGNLKDDLDERYQEVIKQLKNCLKKKGVAPLLSYIHKGSIRQIKRYTCWTKDIFLIVSVGFGLYLFSKYILSVGLEVLNIENENINFVLSFCQLQNDAFVQNSGN